MDTTANTAENWKRFCIRLICLCGLALLLVPSMNWLVDPYDVFRPVELSTSVTHNERFDKVAHLLQHPERYNAFVLGSSRMGLYNPAWFDGIYPGSHFYNLAVFGGAPQDALEMLQALQRGGVRIDRIVMGVDVLTYTGNGRAVTPAYRHHPRVTGESWWSFYSTYLFTPSLLHSVIRVQQWRAALPDIQFDSRSGEYSLPRWDAKWGTGAVPSISKHKPSDKRVQFNVHAFDDLRTLQRWLVDHRVEATFYIAPHHGGELAQLGRSALEQFRSQVESICGSVVDFTREEWMSEDRWYYEGVHYRPVLARTVSERLAPARIATVVARSQGRTLSASAE